VRVKGPAFTLIDGPMGTELARRGIATPGPGWSAPALDAAPDVVAAIHRDYARAGADVHTANTFRTQRRVMGDRWEELARRAVLLARESVPGDRRVAGSVAPVEDCYRPDLSPGAGARAAHRELARVLVDAGVDVLVCETFPNAIEATVAVEECARTGVTTWVALTAGPDASLMTPASMLRAARDCVHAGAAAALVNCTPASATLAYVERLADLEVPVGAYANAGRPDEGLGWSGAPGEAARSYAHLARSWLQAGASIIGGCCGTGPEHVAELARQRTSLTSTRP
jgi:S-methylmethionine-dependent homocysteine/selenocysteine methylase